MSRNMLLTVQVWFNDSCVMAGTYDLATKSIEIYRKKNDKRKSRGPAKNSEMDLMPVFILFQIEIMKELKMRNLTLDN